MKNYYIKMIVFVLMVSCTLNVFYKSNNKGKILAQNTVENLVFNSEIASSRYELEIVYEGMTLSELGTKIDKYLNSTLDNYGEIIAEKALKANVDPAVAASIIIIETGCRQNCSALVKKCNNVGGMKGKGGCGSYAKFATLDKGIDAFINNLSKNYFALGLNTPQKMNKKYAENPNWHKDVNYYVKLIKAS